MKDNKKEPKIVWNKGYTPVSRNLKDILDMMDADGVGSGHDTEPQPLNIKPLHLVKTTIQIVNKKPTDQE